MGEARPVRTPASAEPGGVRAAAVRVVERTIGGRSPADRLLARAARAFDERDRRLLSELVYGVLRWRLRLDVVLARAARRPLEEIDHELVSVLEVAAFQLLFLDRVPAHAAVGEAVTEARRRRGPGAAGFANAVLRRVAGAPELAAWPVEEPDPVRRAALEHSHPELLVRRWFDRFGSEAAERALAAGNGPRALHLLAFADRGGRAALALALAAEGVTTAPSRLSPLGLVVTSGAPLATPAFRRGDFYVQDEASQAAALVPEPRAGELVLDAAAAPGGKGIALLAREPAANVVFSDLSLARVGRVAENLERLGRQAPSWSRTRRRRPGARPSIASCSTLPVRAPARCAATRSCAGVSGPPSSSGSPAARSRCCGRSPARWRREAVSCTSPARWKPRRTNGLPSDSSPRTGASRPTRSRAWRPSSPARAPGRGGGERSRATDTTASRLPSSAARADRRRRRRIARKPVLTGFRQ